MATATMLARKSTPGSEASGSNRSTDLQCKRSGHSFGGRPGAHIEYMLGVSTNETNAAGSSKPKAESG